MEWNWKIIESIDDVDLDIFARRLFLKQVTPPISLYVHPEYYRKNKRTNTESRLSFNQLDRVLECCELVEGDYERIKGNE